MGAAATQRRQIVAGRNTHPLMPALIIFQKKLGFMWNLWFLNVSNQLQLKKKRWVPGNVFLGCIVQSNNSIVRERFVPTPKDGCEDHGRNAWSYQITLIFVLERQKRKLKYLSFAFFPLLLQSTLQYLKKNNSTKQHYFSTEDERYPRAHPLEVFTKSDHFHASSDTHIEWPLHSKFSFIEARRSTES